MASKQTPQISHRYTGTQAANEPSLCPMNEESKTPSAENQTSNAAEASSQSLGTETTASPQSTAPTGGSNVTEGQVSKKEVAAQENLQPEAGTAEEAKASTGASDVPPVSAGDSAKTGPSDSSAASKSSGTSGSTVTSDSSDTSESTVTYESTVTSESTGTSDSSETSEGSAKSGSTVTSESTGTSDSSETSESRAKSGSTVTSESTVTSDSSETSKISATSGSSKASDSAETSSLPQTTDNADGAAKELVGKDKDAGSPKAESSVPTSEEPMASTDSGSSTAPDSGGAEGSPASAGSQPASESAAVSEPSSTSEKVKDASSKGSVGLEKAETTDSTAPSASLKPSEAAQEETNEAAQQEGEDFSFEEALEASLRKEQQRRFRRGDRVKGKIVKIGETMAFVDLGDRAEAMLDLNELRSSDGSLEVDEGGEVEAIVLDVGTNGVLLKRSLGASKESAEQIFAAYQARLPVQARVVGVNKGGLELDLFGHRAFCPASQFALHKVEDFSPFVGETFQFRITEAKEDGSRFVLSRRKLLQEERDAQIQQVRAKLEPGATAKGKVSKLQPFGAFVDFGGIEGLIHVTELSHARVAHPSDVLKVGQEVEVKILKIEESTDKSGRKMERISLSLKALETDPWTTASEDFPVGTRVAGKVVRLQPFGAFVELAPGLDGLVHISEISDERIAQPGDVLKEGDEVMARVVLVDTARKRISLSLREPRPESAADGDTEGRPARSRRRERGAEQEAGSRRDGRREGRRDRRQDRGPGRRKEATEVVQVTVEKVEPYGVQVKLPDGKPAIIPNLEMGTPKGADHRKLFPQGTELKVAIIGQDRSGQARASVVEAEKAEERAAVREWTKAQEKTSSGFGGTFGDLLRKANLVK